MLYKLTDVEKHPWECSGRTSACLEAESSVSTQETLPLQSQNMHERVAAVQSLPMRNRSAANTPTQPPQSSLALPSIISWPMEPLQLSPLAFSVLPYCLTDIITNSSFKEENKLGRR